jgi:hypothetical protein
MTVPETSPPPAAAPGWSQEAAHHPRNEAQAVAGPDLVARVLEPSPPAVLDSWYADDPVAAPTRGRVLGPVTSADVTWQQWVDSHPDRAVWAAERWLGAYRRLPAPPAAIVQTRLALHRLAAYVVSPARRRVNGKIALRWTLGGIGTPFFGPDEQVRIADTTLVRQRGGVAATAPITSLRDAAAFILDGPPDTAWAAEFDVPPAGGVDEHLPVDGDAAAFLADWYGFAYSVLEQLRSEPECAEPSRLQLWPEHFDAAFDCAAGGHRVTFGASPGDATVNGPYLYVLPDATDDSGLWNATSFPGAILELDEFLDAADQRAHALAFYRARRDAVAGHEPGDGT